MIRPPALGLAAAAAVFALIAVVVGIEGDGSARHAAPKQLVTDREIAEGRVLYARMGCGACHALAAAGSRGRIGPELSQRLGRHTRKSLVAVISRPPADSVMPADFAERMTPRELDALAAFLIAARDG